jgi:predicted phage terminase large subunit-like protein
LNANSALAQSAISAGPLEDILLCHLDTYQFVDPAGKPKPGEHLKKTRSRQAIVVIHSDWLGRIFVRDAWAGRLSASRFTERIISTYFKYKPRLCGIEANAMQELYADMVIDKAREQFSTVAMYPIYQSTKVEKKWRIRTVLEPVINAGRLFLLGSMPELETEIRNFPTGDHMDIIDALASAVSLVPKRTAKQQTNDEMKEILHYLRETGASPHQIEQRKRELEFENDRNHYP